MKQNTRKIAGLGLFAAIVVVLQLTGAAIKFGVFSITLTLAPIIIGAALYGIGAGAFLGLAFGIAVLI
ncbi:MAG: ECF transporter S component, partial [Eubacterium sp.]|nr:ECF transporter S component [Eubacterium sp.]